ncbi:MAG: transposase, partial [Microcystis aeruginosa L111-01]|nr:transposase [Microcystis aeruginosa W13-13]NCR21473.1 transposase [Microcystis aeruginosa L111-01]NCS44353.1 transposase [Microcystis aeruginosa BS11-05]NCS52827.1 transposase [Microcystis aeruginosa G13-05]
LSTRTHQCPNCKTVLDRDHNAAINILKKGLKYLGNHLTQTPWESPARKIFSGDIENLSCLVEQGISDSDRSRIPRHSVA